MNSDELHRPLGQNRPEPAAPQKRLLWLLSAAAIALGGGAVALMTSDPLAWSLGGRPYIVAKIEPYGTQEAPPEPMRAPPQSSAAADADTALPAGGDRAISYSEIEQQSGVKVTRRGSGGGGPGPIIIQVEPASGVRLPPAPDHRVAERSRFGVLPRVGVDGLKPMEVYSRPLTATSRLKATAPKIALIVGGVGLNAQSTEAAIDRLPEAVTLAFAPYGGALAAETARARARGHETLLQAPMEPFDYPANSPGPHTLLVENAANLEDLHWLMGRFAGYAGVINFLGGRFTSDESALTPVLAELARRGLFLLDDGSSPQSAIAGVAARQSLPTARVDVILDAKDTPQALDAALAQLEARALETGAAIGFANARPATIERLARFAHELERQGILLAPVSATLGPSNHGAVATGPHK